MATTSQSKKTAGPGSRLMGALKKAVEGEAGGITFIVTLSYLSAVIIQREFDPGHFLGSFLVALAIFYVFFKDIKRYKPVYSRDRKMVLLLGVLVIATLLLGKAFGYLNEGLNRGLNFPDSVAPLFGIPLATGAMLVSLIFDFHSALIFSLVMGLLTGIWFNNPYMPVYTFMGSLTAAFSVIRCKRRSALIKGGMYVSIVNVVIAALVLLLTGNLFSSVAPPSFFFAIISGFFVAALVSVGLPILEYTFGISTDVSLLELLDLDQPLMRSLMINAPGTYHHSIIVGNLAESAAEAVGANPLMARVSSYYHDIGKLKMPDYYVENQQGGPSRHDRLAPHLSSMILVSHLKEGLELAKQHNLPRIVADIIQQHHGTRLMAFFYLKAREQAPDGMVNDEDYRYPGPKPQTRVAALVMMADAVEASARALTDPTPARIAALVEKIINDIFLDGQIDECELTLKDLSEIKKRFTHVLTSIFHKRIQYPDLEPRTHQQREPAVAEGGDQRNGSGDKEQAKIDIP